MTRVSQLRLYEIRRGKLDDFVAAWLAGVLPLRQTHGFTIDAAWVIREESRFVWVVSYEGPESWEAKEQAYYGSPEREAFNPDPPSGSSPPSGGSSRPSDSCRPSQAAYDSIVSGSGLTPAASSATSVRSRDSSAGRKTIIPSRPRVRRTR